MEHKQKIKNSKKITRRNKNSISKQQKCTKNVQINERKNDKNLLLFEALQKLNELQNEIDDFERELDEGDKFVKAETNVTLNEEESQALGYAACAHETLYFLQKEGVAEDSLLYKTLKTKLFNKS